METSTQNIKQRFGIIGNDPVLNRSIEKAMRVSPTDISVLITGESGVGKESFPKIIHQLSHRKHNILLLIVGRFPKELLTLNFLVTKRELSLEQIMLEKDILKLQMAEQYFSMKLGNYR
jgi:DNA-binding NtrC family response regulator